jgi:hypothetical protein
MYLDREESPPGPLSRSTLSVLGCIDPSPQPVERPRRKVERLKCTGCGQITYEDYGAQAAASSAGRS